MKKDGKADCRRTAEDIWSSWPEVSSVPQAASAHAQGCPACRAELEAFRALCRRSTSAEGAPLSWARVLPESRWTQLAARTRRALTPETASSIPLTWAPGWTSSLALAAAAIGLLWTAAPPKKAVLDVPAEAVEKMDLLEHLDLLQNWDVIEALPPDRGATP